MSALGLQYEKYMLAQMIAYYIERNMRTFLNVLPVEYDDGRKKIVLRKNIGKGFPQKFYGIFHSFLDLSGYSNHHKLLRT